MICPSIAEPTVEACLKAAEGMKCAEIRLDGLAEGSGPKEAASIFAARRGLIASCRTVVGGHDGQGVPCDGKGGGRSGSWKTDMLIAAVRAGASFVDVELEWAGPARDEVVRAARAAGARVIVSHHDHEATPSREDLLAIIDRCFEARASIAKIACRVRAPRDNARLLGLLDDERPLIVIGMGRTGRITRVAGLLCGGFLTFASTGEGRETAEGQLEAETLARLIREVDRG